MYISETTKHIEELFFNFKPPLFHRKSLAINKYKIVSVINA